VQYVARRLVDWNISRNRRNRRLTHCGRSQRHDQRYHVIRAAIRINQQRPRHTHTWSKARSPTSFIAPAKVTANIEVIAKSKALHFNKCVLEQEKGSSVLGHG